MFETIVDIIMTCENQSIMRQVKQIIHDDDKNSQRILKLYALGLILVSTSLQYSTLGFSIFLNMYTLNSDQFLNLSPSFEIPQSGS